MHAAYFQTPHPKLTGTLFHFIFGGRAGARWLLLSTTLLLEKIVYPFGSKSETMKEDYTLWVGLLSRVFAPPSWWAPLPSAWFGSEVKRETRENDLFLTFALLRLGSQIGPILRSQKRVLDGFLTIVFDLGQRQRLWRLVLSF